MMRIRRKYAPGKCDDCGWIKRVTWITFWVNGFRMKVCRDCIKPYRPTILKPSRTPPPVRMAS